MIGVNTGNTFTYEVTAAFEPVCPTTIWLPSSGDIFPTISFGAIDCADISTSENALNALKQIDAQKKDFMILCHRLLLPNPGISF